MTIKNPGCQFCRYFIPQFEYQGKPTTEACSKTARKMFPMVIGDGQKKKWKWSDCDYAKEKNSDRLCKDFQIHSLTHKLLHQLSLLLRNAGEQHPPTFKREIWW